MSLFAIISAVQGSKVLEGGGGSGPYEVPTVEGVVYDYPDTGSASGLRYAGFPYPSVLSDNSLFTIFKLSSTHPAGEKLMMGRSIDGGATWTWRQASVGGSSVGGTNLVSSRIDNYIYLARQTDSRYAEISRCLVTDFENNFNTANFTVLQTFDFGAGGGTYLVGTRAFLKLSNDTILLPYFWMGTSEGKCGLLTSEDGTTFTLGADIYFRDNDTPDGLDGDIPVEPCVIESSPGTVCAVMRRYNTGTLSASYFYHAKSTDFGETWTTKVDPAIYKFGEVQDGNPIELVKYDGNIYLINCNRKDPIPFKVELCISTISDFEAENEGSWSTVSEITYNVNASTSPFNVPIDFGYCVAFVDWEGMLWIQFYDISGEHTIGDEGNGRRCWIYQLQITAP